MGRAYEEVMNTSSGVSGELGSVKNCAIAARASGEVRHCSGVQAEARTWQAGLVGVTVVLAGHSVVAQHLQHVGRSLEIAIEGRVAWRAAGVRAQRAARGGVAPTESCMSGLTGAVTYGFSLSMKWRRGLS